MPHRNLAVAVVTPNAIDSELAGSLLGAHHVITQSFKSVCAFANSLSPQFGCAILVEEALIAEELPALGEALHQLPDWFDLPLIIVSRDISAGATVTADFFPNANHVTFLEQPLNPHTLISTVQMALRASLRQREVADLLAEREHAVKLRDEFLAMLAHELRNPLTPIRNVLYLLKRACSGDPSVVRNTEVLERQVNHLARLVDDLLDVARLERGKIALKIQPTDLNRLVAGAVEACLPQARERGQQLIVRLCTDTLVIHADEVRLAQIVVNLVGNAIKFSDRPGEIVVTACAEDNDAVLSVEDQGVGFASAVAEELFNPFVQASATLDRTAGGLGMGLSIVKRLVELHRGVVSATSEGIGKGARFVVRIPLAPGKVLPGPTPEPPPGQVKRQRVVVVEDNADIRETLRILLNTWGHDVSVAADGRTGVERVLEVRPDLALVDIGLPVMDGYEVARSIRSALPHGSIRLVALTGYGQQTDRDRAVQAGFDTHLIKPVDPEVLERLLGE